MIFYIHPALPIPSSVFRSLYYFCLLLFITLSNRIVLFRTILFRTDYTRFILICQSPPAIDIESIKKGPPVCLPPVLAEIGRRQTCRKSFLFQNRRFHHVPIRFCMYAVDFFTLSGSISFLGFVFGCVDLMLI